MSAYYNEHDPFAAAWLRTLITDGLIADGEVDERDIQTLDSDDLRGFTQCHFFAGIGGWSHALRLAGWPDDRPVWTGSCPCQPFSAAGTHAGGDDPRHLWPAWYQLIRECRPVVVFGEQVESAVAHGWLDLVQADLEGEGYAVGAVGLPAASVGAPHIRQRLWFVADAASPRQDRGGRSGKGAWRVPFQPQQFGAAGELADAERGPHERRRHDMGGATGSPEGQTQERQRLWDDAGTGQFVEQLADSRGASATRHRADGGATTGEHDLQQPIRGEKLSPWADLLWLPCRDGKARPTQPGLFPLAHGISNRVGILRGAGNAIVPQVAAAFIDAYLGVTA